MWIPVGILGPIRAELRDSWEAAHLLDVEPSRVAVFWTICGNCAERAACAGARPFKFLTYQLWTAG